MPSAKKCHRLLRRERALATTAQKLEHRALAAGCMDSSPPVALCKRIGKEYHRTRVQLLAADARTKGAGCKEGDRGRRAFARNMERLHPYWLRPITYRD